MANNEYVNSYKLDTTGSKDIFVVQDKGGRYHCVDKDGRTLKDEHGATEFSTFDDAKHCGFENDAEPEPRL